MTERRELYRSPNGDSWFLGREPTDGHAFIPASSPAARPAPARLSPPCRATALLGRSSPSGKSFGLNAARGAGGTLDRGLPDT
jgi:hypothetical protein